MRKIVVTALAAASLFATGTFVGSMHSTIRSNADLDVLFSMSAAAQASGV
jgi:hypothetical protein